MNKVIQSKNTWFEGNKKGSFRNLRDLWANGMGVWGPYHRFNAFGHIPWVIDEYIYRRK